MAPDVEREELDRRVLMAAIGLAVKLCRHLNVPLKELTSLARVAYMKELRQDGLSLSECAAQLDVSERTAKNLARELRTSYATTEAEHTLPTQIEFMLWRAPMSAARLHQVLKAHAAPEVDAAIALLEREQRIELDTSLTTPVYRPTQSINSQLSTEWVKRIGGLDSLIDNLQATIAMRFLQPTPEPEEHAFARTLSFYLSPERHAELVALFWKVIVPRIAELDQASHTDVSARALKLTLFWASRGAPDDASDTTL